VYWPSIASDTECAPSDIVSVRPVPSPLAAGQRRGAFAERDVRQIEMVAVLPAGDRAAEAGCLAQHQRGVGAREDDVVDRRASERKRSAAAADRHVGHDGLQ
jgi:hypothetical protein